MNILSIDAWAEGNDGWTWNAWYKIGSIDKVDFELITSDDDYIQCFIDKGIIEESARDKVSIYDDQYNVVLVRKDNDMPLYAIEYGSEY